MDNYKSRVIMILALFAAFWDGPSAATITYTGSGCLFRQPREGAAVLVACGAGPVKLGGPLTDGMFRPVAGDVYFLTEGGAVVARAPLVGRPQYMPVWRQ